MLGVWYGEIQRQRTGHAGKAGEGSMKHKIIWPAAALALLVGFIYLGRSSVLVRLQSPWGSVRAQPALVIWNPLRDRSPEQASDRFLVALSRENCDLVLRKTVVPADRLPELCRGFERHRLLSWKLVDRHDLQGQVKLVYLHQSQGVRAPEDMAIWLGSNGEEWEIQALAITR